MLVSASAFASSANSDGLSNPNSSPAAPKWTFRKLAGSPKSPVQPSRNSSALPFCAAARESGRQGAAWKVTLNPDFSRLAPNASAFDFGSGMYGRETLVGYQKSTATGSVSPACWRSAFALAGSYGYWGTPVWAKPTTCGGRNW